MSRDGGDLNAGVAGERSQEWSGSTAVLVETCLFVVVLCHRNSILVHGSDMMYEMRRRGKPEPTLLSTQGIFNLPHHIGMI